MDRSALDAAPIPTIVLRDRRIVYANEAALALYHLPREEVLGRLYSDFVAPDELERVADRQARRLRGDPAPSVYGTTLLSGAERRSVQVHAAVAGGDVVVQFIDVTGEAVRRTRLADLARLGALVQRELRDEDVRRAVCEALTSLEIKGVLLRPEGSDLRVEEALLEESRAAHFEKAFGVPLAGSLHAWTPALRQAWAQGAAFSDDWLAEARLLSPGALPALDAAAAARLSAAMLRIDVRGRPPALLLAIGEWLRPEDLPAFRLFGSQISAALDAARAFRALSTRNAELRALNRVAAAAASAPDLDRILGEGARAVRQLLSATHCQVLLLDAVHRELRYGASTSEQLFGLREGRASLEAPLLTAAAVRERRPFAVHEVAGSAFRDVAEAAARGAQAVLAAPLVFRDEPLGVLVVSEHGSPRRFSAAEIERVMAVANQLAVAIHNVRLFEETRGRAEELGLLLEVGRSLVATLELDQVLEAGVRNLARIINAPEAFLLLADAGRTQLVIRAASGSHPELVGRFVSLASDRSVAATVFRQRAPLVIEDGIGDPRVDVALQSATGARAYLGLPLVVRDRAIGAAVIAETRGRRLFTPAEVERAAAIANQLAVAVENARLYADLRRSYAELARAQDQLVRQERLAALGELAAVVAHEVRNPLGVIFNSLGSLRRLVRLEGDARMLFDIVGEEADRLNRMVGDLLDFAKPSPATLSAEPLDRVLDDAIAAALAGAGGTIAVLRDIPDGLPLVPMDAHLMRQAILNVALNAVQAMPEGGTLSVRAGLGADGVVIELADTGEGIPDEVRHRIFEPFFTTKATGTGLGLAVVKRILDDHRGRVQVRAVATGGTLFALHLPLIPPGPVQQERGLVPRRG